MPMSLQSSIRAEGFRSLREGEFVEFDVEPGEDGRNKAINVSGPGGAAPLVSVGAAVAAIPSFCQLPTFGMSEARRLMRPACHASSSRLPSLLGLSPQQPISKRYT